MMLCSKSLSQKLFNHRWMFLRGMLNFLSVGRTPWCLAYKTTRFFCFSVYWRRMDFTLTSLLTMYKCRLNILELPVVGQRLAITFQWALSWPPYRTLYRLLPTFGRCRLKQSSDVVFYTKAAEVNLQGRYLARSKHTRAHEGDFPSNNLGAV